MRSRTAVGAAAVAAILVGSVGRAQAGRVRALTTGNAVTCAVDYKAGLWCWGRNNAGQLGDGTTAEQHGPERVAGNFLAMTRDDNTCTALQSGRVKCTGANDHGQIGDNTTVERHAPTSIFLTTPPPPPSVPSGGPFATVALGTALVAAERTRLRIRRRPVPVSSRACGAILAV